MKYLISILTTAVCFLVTTTTIGQTDSEKETDKKESASKIKPYDDIITDEVVSDSGLFTVHHIVGKYYFEIPNDLLEKEILVVSRISGFVKNLSFGGAGMKSRPQQVIRFQRKGEKILLRSVSYNSVASHEDPIYQSVVNNNFEPIILVFDIKCLGREENSVVIQVNPFFEKDIAMIGALRDQQRKNFGIKGLDDKRSLIEYIKSFPENVEVRHVLTYRGDKLPDNNTTQTLSLQMNQSFILLPEEPMTPRKYDERVGYFSIRQNDYSMDEQKAASKRFVTRWKLVPKDIDAYKRGELVEPEKPIVYYIDPATPEKWKPYIKQGVNDWQPAFEAAGFKNAIYAADPPSHDNDPDWSPEDVRYSVIRYISTDIQNAQGPHVHDPRTGEILESDILWYHNVMNLLRNWFFIQTAAINPEARSVKFKDKVMGELIRFVSAHEVGHTLGLPHNMGSSVAYHVDSLRSKTFTDTHGTAPSIMDYARFNYIAQPEDRITNFYPRIGEYDVWSIIYGYKYIPDVDAAEDEKETLHQWILERADDPTKRYGRQSRGGIDPTSQREDLGHDAMLASELGIKNLKRIVPRLVEWSDRKGEDYEDLEELYSNVFAQLNRYLGHVTRNVGGIYKFTKTYDQEGPVFTHVEKRKQQRAVNFLVHHLFNTPIWLMDKEIFSYIDYAGHVDRIRQMQDRTINMLFNGDRLLRVGENEAINGTAAYGIAQLFSETKNGIYGNGKGNVDAIKRGLQRAFVDKLANLLEVEDDKVSTSDIRAMANGTLLEIRNLLAKSKHSDKVMKYHAKELVARIDEVLNTD